MTSFIEEKTRKDQEKGKNTLLRSVCVPLSTCERIAPQVKLLHGGSNWLTKHTNKGGGLKRRKLPKKFVSCGI